MAGIVAERVRLLSQSSNADRVNSMSHDHEHAGSAPGVPSYEKLRDEAMATNRKAMKKLCIVLFTSIIFICIEITGGIYANSIAIMSDAAHIASDVIGFGISICALRIAHKDANAKYTFGYHRVEIIGAFCSLFTIWIMTAWLVYEAIGRFFDPDTSVVGPIMLTVACMSFIFNLIQIKILHSGEGGHVHLGGGSCSGDHGHSHGGHDHGHDHGRERTESEIKAAEEKKNLNVEAAFLHILGDLLNSVGVIIAATIIFFWPELDWLDPTCTLVFAVIVMYTTRLVFW